MGRIDFANVNLGREGVRSDEFNGFDGFEIIHSSSTKFLFLNTFQRCVRTEVVLKEGHTILLVSLT